MLKNKLSNTLILLLLLAVFIFQYYFIIDYFNEIFQYTTEEIKNIAINDEINKFQFYLLEMFVFLLLQSIGMFLCLNIGLLYLNIKFNKNELIRLIIISFCSIIFSETLIMLIIKLNNDVYTVASVTYTSEKFNLISYLNLDNIFPWIKLSLSSININQFLVFIFLGIGMHKILKVNYVKAFLITIKTYGLGFLLWFVFAMVMEMNF